MLFDMDPGCVSLLAGGDRGVRLNEEGVTVNEKRYMIPVVTPEESGPPVDLIIVAVKDYHLSTAITDMANLVGPSTTIISVMNGIESEERIGLVYGREKLLLAVAVGIDAVREDNCVRYTTQGRLLFGEENNTRVTKRVKALQALFDRAGIVWETPVDMVRTMWWKFMINVGVNQVSAVLRASYGVFQRSAEAKALMESAMREVIVLGEAAGVRLDEEDIMDWYAVLGTLSPEGKTSMMQDMEAGRKTEVEMFAGKVMKLGGERGIPTPVNDTLYRILRVMGEHPPSEGMPE